jgi:ubiquinone/menaquinone biosynthesis C-methylase UbiE
MDADILMQMVTGYQASAIVRTGLTMGVFDQLEGGAGVGAVSSAIGASERGTRILLDALTALGVIAKADDRYQHTDASRLHLVSESPAFLGGSIQLFTSNTMWDGMRSLDDAVRSGGTVMPEHAETPEHPFWEDFAQWTVGMAGVGGAALVEALGDFAAHRERLSVLDVAAGSGMYGYAIAQAYPTAHVTSLDWPNVLEHAAKNVSKLGLQDRVTMLEGNMFEVAIDQQFDVVIMSHVFHHFDEATCVQLMRRAAGWLAPAGRLVIHDFIAADAPGAEPFPYLFSTFMLSWTQKGRAYSASEYRRMLAEARLSEVALLPLPGPSSRVLMATRNDKMAG